MGLSNCQHDFMYPNLHHGHLKKVKLSYDYTHLQYTVVHENYDILLLVIIQSDEVCTVLKFGSMIIKSIKKSVSLFYFGQKTGLWTLLSAFIDISIKQMLLNNEHGLSVHTAMSSLITFYT